LIAASYDVVSLIAKDDTGLLGTTALENRPDENRETEGIRM